MVTHLQPISLIGELFFCWQRIDRIKGSEFCLVLAVHLLTPLVG